uniref:Uncharacterized protein n=1 Tax=Panagrolaimus sp. ES5 TaxID=591445 RepID=A0AC34G052_9BILA
MPFQDDVQIAIHTIKVHTTYGTMVSNLELDTNEEYNIFIFGENFQLVNELGISKSKSCELQQKVMHLESSATKLVFSTSFLE